MFFEYLKLIRKYSKITKRFKYPSLVVTDRRTGLELSDQLTSVAEAITSALACRIQFRAVKRGLHFALSTKMRFNQKMLLLLLLLRLLLLLLLLLLGLEVNVLDARSNGLFVDTGKELNDQFLAKVAT